MQFELTDSAIDDILFYMENQNGDFVFNAVVGEVVPKDEFDEFADFDEDTIDMNMKFDAENSEVGERFYKLPEWSSVDGFRLMEHFVGSLRNPPAKKDLLAVLTAGKGVFRSFKDVLSKYPEIEKKWYVYKDEQMKIVIRSWYNDLRESWHLERLPEELSENMDFSENFILSDFTIRIAKKADLEVVQSFCKKTRMSFTENFNNREIGEVCGDLWAKMSVPAESADAIFLVAETASDEVVGAVQINVVSKNSCKICLLAMLYVEPDYRGLGVATTLLQKAMDYAVQKEFKYILTVNVVLPDSILKVLLKNGFEQLGSGYLLKLVSNN